MNFIFYKFFALLFYFFFFLIMLWMIINNKKTKANPNAQIAMILGILIIIYFSSSA